MIDNTKKMIFFKIQILLKDSTHRIGLEKVSEYDSCKQVHTHNDVVILYKLWKFSQPYEVQRT
jgi:hypothetical protein